jgi:hypothetical protein
MRIEEEVDAGERAAITAVDHLRTRPLKPRLAHESEEATLEHGVPAAVDEELVE